MPPCRCQGFTGPPIQGFPRLLTLLRSLSLHVGEDGACERSVRISAGTHDKKASRHMRWMSFGAHMKTIARRIRTALLLSALLLFGSLHGAEAGVNVWTTNGPEGGSISALAVDPQTPTTLYAGTTSAGVFKSIDGGTHWRAVNAGLGATSVRALAIDPQTPTALYAAFWGGGVFKSTDGGANWSNISSGLIDPYGDRGSAIPAMAINPHTPTTLYAGTTQGVFKSTDGGNSWSAANVGLSATSVLALDIDPQASIALYAGTSGSGLGVLDASISGGGVFKSTNGGGGWSPVNTGLIATAVSSVALYPQDPRTIYAGTSDRIFKSSDCGSSWSAVNIGPSPDASREMAIDPQTLSTLYASTYTKLFKSSDGGSSWSPVNVLRIRSILALAVDPQTPTTVYVGTNGDNLFRSTDGGSRWRPLGPVRTPTLAFYLQSPPPAH